MNTRLLFALAAGPLLVGCAGSPDVSHHASGRATPPSFDAKAPSWAPAGSDVVASVNGVPITAEMVQIQLEAHPGTTPKEQLARLVELEAVGQRAGAAGLSGQGEVAETWRQALVQRYLADVFEAKHAPTDLTIEEVKRIFYQPQIRKIYNHADAWHAVHLMVPCCDPRTQDCDDPDIVACFASGGEAATTAYGLLMKKVAGLKGDAQAMMKAMERFGHDHGQQYGLAFQEMRFFYHPTRPHAEQKGYNITAEAVARTVVDAPVGVPQEPVQTQFGWHILMKVSHDPERRQDPDHPEVIADIRKNMYPRLLFNGYIKEMSELITARKGLGCKDDGDCTKGWQCSPAKFCINGAVLDQIDASGRATQTPDGE